MSSTKIEFAVKMTCDNCVKAVEQAVDNVDGIKNVDINLEQGSVVVDTTLSADEVLRQLRKSGKQVVLKGYGNVAAVAVMECGTPDVKGVVRFVEESPRSCIIDGTIDGLSMKQQYELTVNECGDLSRGCDNVGNCLFLPETRTRPDGRPYGSLGYFTPSSNGRAVFRFDDSMIKLSEIIGRSLVVTDRNGNQRLTCGIIARSAGVFQNPKTICACDGISIWDEGKVPGHQQAVPKSKQ